MKLAHVLALSSQLFLAAAQSNSTDVTTLPLSTDSEFSYILSVVLALSNNLGSNTGEVLRAASQITPGDFESWYTQFSYLAGQIEAQGDSTTSPIGQLESYFHAASYYRTSTFFLVGNSTDPRLLSTWDSQLRNFAKAIELLQFPGEKLTIQGPGFTIPAYFYPADTYCSPSKKAKRACVDSVKRPTIIAVSGYDGSQEDLYHGIGRQATSRGYNFISYEGPGQPTVRREQGLGFIPNWDAVVSPVVDYLRTRDDVDTDKLILHGHSFGAILAVRAAAVLQGRFAGVTLADGLYNLQKVLRELFPAQLIQLYDARNESAFNAYTQAIYDSGLAPTNFKWVVDQGRWAFNTKSYFNWFDQLGNYTIDGYAQNLTVPVFVGGADHDTAGLEQAPAAAEMIGSEATFHLSQSNTGAGEHCQIGAESQLGLTMYDWVAKVVG